MKVSKPQNFVTKAVKKPDSGMKKFTSPKLKKPTTGMNKLKVGPKPFKALKGVPK